MDKLASRWTEIDALRPIRDAAEELLREHPLRAADSLQLGACVVVFGARRLEREFIVLDELLAEAARQEGFKVVVPKAW